MPSPKKSSRGPAARAVVRAVINVHHATARAIGRETAETLAARGAAVVSVDLSSSGEAVEAITAGGGIASGLVADVTDEAAVEEAFAAVLETYGSVDILVNNAGLFAGLERRPFWEIDLAEWERVLAANVRSVFLCSRAASRPMRAGAFSP